MLAACSPARLVANRSNAQRSTGPRTPEGKARSALNALKHGNSARTCIAARDQQRNERLAVRIAADFEPQSPYERSLVSRMSRCIIVAQRLQSEEEADYQRRRRRALDRWENSRVRSLSKLIDGFKKNADAFASLRPLSRRSDGCDFLAAQWTHLRRMLAERAGGWKMGHARRALRLLACTRVPTIRDLRRGEPAARLWLLVLATSPSIATTRNLDRFFAGEPAEMPPPEAARAELEELLAQEIHDWSESAAELWRESDEADRDEAIDRVATDMSAKGQLRQRYFRDHMREMHACLRELRRHRAESDSPDASAHLAGAVRDDDSPFSEIDMQAELNDIHGAIDSLARGESPADSGLAAEKRNEPNRHSLAKSQHDIENDLASSRVDFGTNPIVAAETFPEGSAMDEVIANRLREQRRGSRRRRKR